MSFKFNSQFRDFTSDTLEDLFKPKEIDGSEQVPKGMVTRNKKLVERLE